MTDPDCTCTPAARTRGWSTECAVPAHRLSSRLETAPGPGGLRHRPGDQAPPTGATTDPGAHDAIIALMQQRKALGLARYGSTLQPHNGRDTGRDLIEELADGIVYARTLQVELSDLEEALVDLVRAVALGETRDAWSRAKELLARRGAL